MLFELQKGVVIPVWKDSKEENLPLRKRSFRRIKRKRNSEEDGKIS